MILLLGNNECVRHDILLSLFMKKYYVSEHRIDEGICLTKPFMTVYINPNSTEIQKIKNEKTFCVVAKNNMPIKAPLWMHVIPYGNTTAEHIMELYEKNCPFGKGREIFGILCLEGKKFCIGGAYVHMPPKQLKAIKILLYNSGKQFSSFDICSYFDFVNDPISNFGQMVHEINYQCRRAGREKIIIAKNDKYYINPDVINY